MTPRAYFDAYHATDSEIRDAAGLAEALVSLAVHDSFALNTDHPTARAIISLTNVLQEKIERVSQLHEVEWNPARGKAPA
jgi:hypothetical protein